MYLLARGGAGHTLTVASKLPADTAPTLIGSRLLATDDYGTLQYARLLDVPPPADLSVDLAADPLTLSIVTDELPSDIEDLYLVLRYNSP
jgi:hypothetical protein